MKQKEFINNVRDKAIMLVVQEVQKSNNIPKTTSELSQYAKFLVGFGNNFQLVKSILKNRWWLQSGETDSFEECNLIWTSWRKSYITEELMTLDQYDEQGNNATQSF